MKTKVAIGIVFLALLIGVGVAYANSTVDLQPMYRLMNGDVQMGLVYYLGDAGIVTIVGDNVVQSCLCGEAACYDGTEVVPSNTPVPTKDPTKEPTQEPTDPPPTEKPKKQKCNAGRGNGSEGDPDCDPGNSGGHNQGGD